MAHGTGIPFGKYRLVKRLARGGMAEVFLAHQMGPEGFQRRVAVKRILPHLADTDEFVRMFHDEAKLAAALSHPNVVHIYEFGKFDEYFFIAMEYVDGVDAAMVVKQSARGAAPPELVARMLADGAAGLHHAHQLRDNLGQPIGIVHRDISPQNLLISFDGVVKVVDFGIAKAAHQAERTRPGVVKGKYAYMSPEQVVGKPLDGRSDVFSLAIVGWEMLAGRWAVSREDPTEAMKTIRDGKLPRIESVRADVPRVLADIIGRALANNVADRPTAAQLGLELEAYLKSATRIATSLAVSEWVQDCFPRESSGPARELSQGTSAGTSAGTAAGTGAGVVPGTAATPAAGAGSAAATRIEIDAPRGRAPSVLDAELDSDETMLRAATVLERERESLVTAETSPRARRRWLVIAASATLSLAVSGAIVASGALDGKPRAAQVASNQPAAPVTPPPAPSVAALGATQTPPVPVPVPGDADPDVAGAPPAADTARHAEIEIITEPPGARVVFDGAPLTELTPARVDRLLPGEHTLRVTREGYKPVERNLELAAGDRRTFELALTPLPGTPPPERPRASARDGAPRARPSTGWLTVRTNPYSEVYLGRRKLGTTPLADVELPAGTHTLVFKNPEQGARRRKVVIRPGATTKLSFEL